MVNAMPQPQDGTVSLQSIGHSINLTGLKDNVDHRSPSQRCAPELRAQFHCTSLKSVTITQLDKNLPTYTVQGIQKSISRAYS